MRVSGDVSSGKSKTKVGSHSFEPTSSSQMSSAILPATAYSLTPTPNFSAICTRRSRGVWTFTSSPTASDSEVYRSRRLHSPPTSYWVPSASVTVVVPKRSRAAFWIRSRVRMAISSYVAKAWYASIAENSGECVESAPSLRKFLPISKTRSMPPTTAFFRYSSVAMRR